MQNDEYLDIMAVCAFIGGSRPVHPATIYRGVKKGIYPPPVKMAPNVNRWLRSELEQARKRRIAERDGAVVA